MMPLAPIRPARKTKIDITKDGALYSCWSGSPKYTRHCERSEAIQERIARESRLLRRPFGAPRNDAANSIRPEYAPGDEMAGLAGMITSHRDEIVLRPKRAR